MKVRAVLDRFEDGKAVLLIGDDEAAAAWPRACLPAGAREGDVLWLDISVDADATRVAKEEAEALLRQLLDRNK